jgi:nucleoside-diphosphate-sugar epimerase
MEGYEGYYSGKRVLVTGGAGAIGSNLVRALAHLGARPIVVLDDMSAAVEWNIPSEPSVLFVRGSVVDEADLKRVFSERPDVVFHLAAFFANQNSVDYPERDLMVNGMGTLRVLEYCAMAQTSRVVYASSGCSIYGSTPPLPISEDFVSTYLTTPYQATKMLGELYANFFHHHYGLPVVKTRFFNSYGPGEVPGQYRNVIPNFVYWAMLGRSLPIAGNGEATRDFTFVRDIVDGLLRAGFFEEAVGQDINLASGREVRIGELAHMVNDLVGNEAPVVFVGQRKWDTKMRLCASVERARKLLGYQPMTTIENGLQATVDWFRGNWARIVSSAEFTPGMNSAVREMQRV